MRATVRFDIVIDSDWAQTITCSSPAKALGGGSVDLKWETVTRKFKRYTISVAGDPRVFPGPPDAELAAIDGPHRDWCEGRDLAALADTEIAIGERLPTDKRETFGRYLYAVLVGDAVWKRMLETAVAAGVRLIELSICSSDADPRFQELNWEMLHGPHRFLAAGAQCDGTPHRFSVAITRRVASAAEMPAPMIFPPRLLFVVGASLTDKDIKPGAEVLGLLEQFEHDGTRVQSRVLQRQSPAAIQRAVGAFRPDVVHFICHGDIDTRTGGYLRLEQDPPSANNRYFAADILEMLRVPARGNEAAWLPRVVVLSACFAAGGTPAVMGAPAVMPLAVQLVVGGLPIVIAMTGRVSDVGCRLFTRRLGEMLLKEGDGLIAATAEARRASFQMIGGNKPSAMLDWASPALFLSSRIDHDYVAITPEARARGERIRTRIKIYGVRKNPIFCARYEFADAYDELLRNEDRPVLAAYVESAESGLGRTRLLQELAARAIRDGHVPCLIASENPDWAPPKNLAQFAAQLMKAIDTARTAFKLDPVSEANSELLKLLLKKHGSPELEEYRNSDLIVGKVLELSQSFKEALVGVIDLKGALKSDLRQLLYKIRGAPGGADASSRALILLDQVERYDNALPPLLHEMLDDFGLGTSDEVVPVVLVGSLKTPADQFLWPWLEQGKPWLMKIVLSRFKEDGEDMLAYQRVLLHPQNSPGPNRTLPLAFNDDADEEVKADFYREFRAALRGMPSQLKQLRLLGGFALAGKFLKEADDETRLKQERDGVASW
jgi:hypothetical protein